MSHMNVMYIVYLFIDDPLKSHEITQIRFIQVPIHSEDALQLGVWGMRMREPQEFHCRDQVFHLRQLVDARQGRWEEQPSHGEGH